MKPNPRKYSSKYEETKSESRFKPCPFCGKNSYPDQKTAEEAKTTGEIVSFEAIELKVYRCPYGRGWHLSSK